MIFRGPFRSRFISPLDVSSDVRSHGFAGFASTARFTFRTFCAQNDFPSLVPASRTFDEHHLSFLFASEEELIGDEGASHRGPPLHPGADQAALRLLLTRR